MLARKSVIATVLMAALLLLLGCGLLKKSKSTGESTTAENAKQRHPVEVEVPWDTSARDDINAPILRVAVLDDGVDGVPVPYIYGYPLYAGGDAARGILKLRQDNWTGAEQEQYEDEAGVVRLTERFPEIGCEIEGVKETDVKFVPLTLICDLPPPKNLGGAQRPVVGALKSGARARQIVQEPSLNKAFLGDWHATSDGFAAGDGEGYFNTEHGLLAFDFERGRLIRISFYFHPAEKKWQAPMLWVKP